jgi:transketolase
LFDQQSDEYQESVLPTAVRKRVSVEAGLSQGWERYIGLDGLSVGLSSYGKSAPGGELFDKFKITSAAVLEAARKLLANA